ncbi:MAG: DUF6702 family protein [Sphingomonadales bacterium]
MQTVLALFLWLLMLGSERPGAAERSMNVHPFHVSVTDIRHNVADRTLEVQCKLFTDDFESALKKVYHQKADLIDPSMHTLMDTLVSRYVQASLQLRINEKPVVMQYLGFEHEREASYVYLEVANVVGPIRTMDCSAKLLYELFTDQVNIFHVATDKAKKSVKLDYPAQTVRIDLN